MRRRPVVFEQPNVAGAWHPPGFSDVIDDDQDCRDACALIQMGVRGHATITASGRCSRLRRRWCWCSAHEVLQLAAVHVVESSLHVSAAVLVWE